MSPSPQRALVVDDSPLVRKVVSKLLTEKGMLVKTADSGEAAFRMILEQSFHIVITDVIMGALSGMQLCRLIRSTPELEHVPVILLTAAYDPRSRFWGTHSGADATIAKETMKKELFPEVERLLTQRTTQSATRSIRASGSTDPLQRLAHVFDALLFQAVVSAEARRLLTPGTGRAEFTAKTIDLLSQITDYAYLVFHLRGPAGPSWVIHARAPWPNKETSNTYASLGLDDVDPDNIVVIVEPDVEPAREERVQSGEMYFLPIGKPAAPLASLTAFGGHKRIGASERATFEQLANELELVITSLFLREETEKLALTDPLTGLHNRRSAHEILTLETERAKRYATPFGVAMIDIDHFKQVNDSFGHAMGDEALHAVAESLQATARTTDVVTRWGGEEFAIFLANTDMQGCRHAADRFREQVERIPPFDGGPASLSVSVGVAVYEEHDTPETLIERADHALYRAKRGGRNRVVTVTGEDPEIRRERYSDTITDQVLPEASDSSDT